MHPGAVIIGLRNFAVIFIYDTAGFIYDTAGFIYDTAGDTECQKWVELLNDILEDAEFLTPYAHSARTPALSQ